MTKQSKQSAPNKALQHLLSITDKLSDGLDIRTARLREANDRLEVFLIANGMIPQGDPLREGRYLEALDIRLKQLEAQDRRDIMKHAK